MSDHPRRGPAGSSLRTAHRWWRIALALVVGAVAVYAVTRHRSMPTASFMIYDDAFVNGAALDQSNGVNDATSTSVVQDGKRAIASTIGSGGAALFIRLPDGVALSRFSQLRFWVKGEGSGGLPITAAITNDGDQLAGPSQQAMLTEGRWTEVTVPMNALVTDRATFDAVGNRMLRLQLAGDPAGRAGTLYFDSIELRTPA